MGTHSKTTKKNSPVFRTVFLYLFLKVICRIGGLWDGICLNGSAEHGQLVLKTFCAVAVQPFDGAAPAPWN